MRRHQDEITGREEIDTILRRCTVGRLATIGRHGYPYITPVNYTYLNGSIYFHSAREGEKMENIQSEPKVCFEVDIPLSYLGRAYDSTRPVCQVTQFYHCVIIRGRAEIVMDIKEKIAALNSLMASHENMPDFDEITKDTAAVSACHVVAVRIESISGKRNLARKKTAEEQLRIAAFLLKRGMPGDREAARLLNSQADSKDDNHS